MVLFRLNCVSFEVNRRNGVRMISVLSIIVFCLRMLMCLSWSFFICVLCWLNEV